MLYNLSNSHHHSIKHRNWNTHLKHLQQQLTSIHGVVCIMALVKPSWCMCDRASYMKMTRGTNLMQQLWSIIINNSTCFGHLYVHLQEFRLCASCMWCSALGVVTVVLRSRCVVLCTVCVSLYPTQYAGGERTAVRSPPACCTTVYRRWRYQRLWWYNLSSWWWAACCSKHVEDLSVTYILLKNKGIVHYVGNLKKSILWCTVRKRSNGQNMLHFSVITCPVFSPKMLLKNFQLRYTHKL